MSYEDLTSRKLVPFLSSDDAALRSTVVDLLASRQDAGPMIADSLVRSLRTKTFREDTALRIAERFAAEQHVGRVLGNLLGPFKSQTSPGFRGGCWKRSLPSPACRLTRAGSIRSMGC